MKNNIGSYTLIKNEITFIKAHLDSWLPYLAQMVFYDGNSTDGTLEIIKQARCGEHGHKITLIENKDPKDYTKDYQRLFNECMWELQTDLALFIHPDMFLSPYSKLNKLPDDCVAAGTHIRSFAGEDTHKILEISGRGEAWKNIYRLRNPNLGAHFFGAYGAQNEDTYFSEITGNEHNHYGVDFKKYPYEVYDSGIQILHYSDVRPHERRLDRMIKCLINQGVDPKEAKSIALKHPRVTLKPGNGFDFKPVETPIYLGGTYEC